MKSRDFSGPAEFAAKIQAAIEPDRWRTKDPVVVSPLTVRETIEATFAASLLPEEGRFPQFTAALFLSEKNPFEDMAAFDPPLSVTPDVLRKICPSVPPYPHVLAITEENGTPQVRAIEPLFHDHLLMTSWGEEAGPRKVLLLSVRGPGELLAVYSATKALYLLQGGRIRELSALSGPDVSEEAELAFHFKEESTGSFWIPTLRRMIGMAHGGVLIRLPHEGVPIEEVLAKHASKLSITYKLKPYMNLWEYVNMYGSRPRLINAKSLMVSHMSLVDGCVVLDHLLRFVGFGAKLRVDVANIPPCVNYAGDASPLDLSNRGMRHRSAARFAFEVPSCTAVVVSQDGDIHVFRRLQGSDALTVYGPFGDIPLLSPPLSHL
ncbi:MAG: DNA integrity scanning protein DisA nucleotide-binding domain protein [Syntrophaceae bacterium]|nr:DNA integrity scanning protein DisA nucleotide-binding domain protein [Syntrophaceae bacterium]